MTPERGTTRPTIKDVAAEAGVSVATVSNVVNGHPHVRPVTRDKVFAAIETLGYQASRAAKGLPAGRTHLLAYCLMNGGNANAALDAFLREMVSTASAAELEFLLFARVEGQSPTDPYAQLLRRGGADGFILADIEYNDARVEFLRRRNIPFACFGRVADPQVTWVEVDGAAGSRAAIDHLVDLGHERVSYIGWPEGSSTGDDRLRGALDACDSHGVEVTAVERCVNDFDAGRKMVADAIGSGSTAVVCVSDTIALGAMAGARDLGFEPGRDLAVVGFDYMPAASLTQPGLTSLRQPIAKVGAQLVERLVGMLDGETTPTQALVEPDLIVREST